MNRLDETVKEIMFVIYWEESQTIGGMDWYDECVRIKLSSLCP